jgi:hypothetical protein
MRVSDPPVVYPPHRDAASAWDEALERFAAMKERA